MIGLGFAEILLLALLGGGMNSTDLVTLIQPTHYFQSRQIEVSIDKMVELAARDPKDPRTQVQQLVALRYLAEEVEMLKKSPNFASHRTVLEQVAQGKKASDPAGFAQEFATRVLVRLGVAKLENRQPATLRKEALTWFPANATFAFAIDLQTPQGGPADQDPLRDILKLVPDQAKKEMYDHIEKAGNLRIERIAFATVDGNGKREDQKMFLRITGKGNHAWATEMLRTFSRGAPRETKQWKDDKGTPISLIQDKGQSPAVVLLGDTDLVVTGFDRPSGKDRELVDEVLDLRSQKKPNAASGVLKAALAKVPDRAVGLAVGHIPEELKRDLRGGLGAAPNQVTAFIERTQLGLDVQVEAGMANGDDSRAVVQKVGELRKLGIAGLQQAMQQPLPPGFPPVPFQSLINVLESLQVQSKDDSAHIRVVVPDNLIRQLGSMSSMMFGMSRDIAPPPPPPKQ